MKLLVIGHTYLTAFNQSKYVEMKRQCADLQLRILTPPRIRHTFGEYRREIASDLSSSEVVDIGGFNFGRSHMSYILSLKALAKILRKFKPDRIHIEEDPYSAVGVEVVTVARAVGCRAKFSFFIWDNLAREPSQPKKWLKWTLDRYALRRAELVVCGNRDGETLLREKRGYRGRTAVLPQMGLNPADYSIAGRRETVRAELSVASGDVLVGFVGRLVPEKGLNTLLAALQRIRELPWKLLILGGGPMEPDIVDASARSGGRIVFKKTIPHAEVPGYIQALDVLVLPSVTTPTWKEQFGIVLAQAMIAGVPCVGSSSGAIPDVIGPGGVVFQEGSVDDLVDKLTGLIAAPNLRKRLSQTAREFANNNYSNSAVAGAYLQLFRA